MGCFFFSVSTLAGYPAQQLYKAHELMTKEKLKLTHIPLVSVLPISHAVQQLTPLALKKTQLNQYEGGDCADKLLALQLSGKEVKSMSTKKEGGGWVYSPDKTNPEFYKFCKSLDTVIQLLQERFDGVESILSTEKEIYV